MQISYAFSIDFQLADMHLYLVRNHGDVILHEFGLIFPALACKRPQELESFQVISRTSSLFLYVFYVLP